MDESGDAAATTTADTIESHRAATLAKLEAMGRGETVDEKKPPAASEPDPESEPDEEPDPDAEAPPGEPDEEREPEPDPDEEPDPDAEPDAKDPDLAKRLAAVKKAERRSREQLADERAQAVAELDRRAKEIGAQYEAVERFEKLKGRRGNMVAIARELGVPDDEFEDVARQFHAETPAGAKDPRYKEMVRRAAADREQSDKLTALEKKQADLETEIKRRDKVAADEKIITDFRAALARAVTDKAPRVRAILAKSPARAQRDMGAIAADMIQRTGEVPAHAAVVAAYEKDLADLGVAAPNGKPEPPKGKDGKPVAKNGQSGAAKPAKTLAEHRAETLRRLETGKLD